LKKTNKFWALVRYATQQLGYSTNNRMMQYNVKQIADLNKNINVKPTDAKLVCEYMKYRSKLIEEKICWFLMNRIEAKKEFEKIKDSYSPTCKLPMNKQKNEKKHYRYLTCIVNMLTELNIGMTFNDDPQQLVIITNTNKGPVTVMSRRVDGAFPDVDNPVAIWETKEYYGTTTFGSRVADGVYETQLDGYELREAEKLTGRKIEHYLIVDGLYTWWADGKSYLVRLVDMMHMGLVDEVIFGKEVITRWPAIVRKWRNKKLPS
jgi:hypothetical protein